MDYFAQDFPTPVAVLVARPRDAQKRFKRFEDPSKPNETPRFFRPKHGWPMPKETPRFSNQNMTDPSQLMDREPGRRPPSRHRYQTSQAKKHPFLVKNHRRGPDVRFCHKKTPSRSDKPGSGKASRDGGCRYPTPKLDGPAGQPETWGRSRDPNRTQPDSNGVPRDVPDSPELCTHSTKMSVFWAHRRKSSASIESQTGGKSAHRSKPVKSRPDRPGKKSKPHGTEVGLNWVRYPQTDPDAPGCKGTLG